MIAPKILIKTLGKADLQSAFLFCQHLCSSMATRAYPLFEGENLQQEIALRLSDSGKSKGFALAAYQDKIMRGLVFGFAQPEDNYLQTTGFYVVEGAINVAEKLLEKLQASFPGLEAMIGIPAENATLGAALLAQHYQKTEDSRRLEFPLSTACLETMQSDAVHQVSLSELPRYALVHDHFFPDIYWNADRSVADVDRFMIHIFEEEGQITGAVFIKNGHNQAEVYGLKARLQQHISPLLTTAINALQQRFPDCTSLLFLEDAIKADVLETAMGLGFVDKGGYQLWERTL